jgi:hypothetical protein
VPFNAKSLSRLASRRSIQVPSHRDTIQLLFE